MLPFQSIGFVETSTGLAKMFVDEIATGVVFAWGVDRGTQTVATCSSTGFHVHTAVTLFISKLDAIWGGIPTYTDWFVYWEFLFFGTQYLTE